MSQTVLPPAPTLTYRPSGGVMATILGIGTLVYILLAVGCAGYLIWTAYVPAAAAALSEFSKLAIAALIAVVGTGLTAMGAVFSATRQSATAFQVASLTAETNIALAQYNATVSETLSDIKVKSDAQLTQMKLDLDEPLAKLRIASDDALARLRVGLDTGQIGYRELSGTATSYFYALRSIARGQWDERRLNEAETAMIAASRHLIYVDESMRNQWQDFWQRAQDIYSEARAEPDADKRPDLIRTLIVKDVKVRDGNKNFRELQLDLERTAKQAMVTEELQS